MEEKIRAERNRTITLKESEREKLRGRLLAAPEALEGTASFLDCTINADLLQALPLLPDSFADLIIIDPPYNLRKNFNGSVFTARDEAAYEDFLMSWFPQVCRKLKSGGSLYMCGDWKCTSALQRVISRELTILNRITWQR